MGKCLDIWGKCPYGDKNLERSIYEGIMNDIVDTSGTERRIAERLDPRAAGELGVSRLAGGLAFANMEQVMHFAKMMAISQVAVPKHLRGNPGACLGIVMQAIEWDLSPFAVANKSFSVNDRLSYEAQLINAVIIRRAPITGRFSVEFSGDGEKRRCTIALSLKEGGTVNYTSPEIGRIPIKNSPLWKSDPDQQLFYYASRALCRRHFPDVLMGVYSKDELEEAPRIGPNTARDVTPKRPLAERLTAIAEAHVNNEPQPEHDAETGEIHADAEATEQLDTETTAIKLAGILAARNGKAEFSKWWKRLSAPDAERAEPYIEELHAILAEKEASHG